jgi:signal transduction histidine kinase
VPFDLCELLDAELPAYHKSAADNGLDIERLPCVDPCMVQADPRRVRQVIHNLVSNAIKFTDSGCIKVGIEPAPGSIRVAVTDTGIGIAERDLGTLFEPFTQVELPTHHSREGTGLGLAIARRLVEAMGGTIGVTSESGKGSCFWFTLPRAGARNDSCAS